MASPRLFSVVAKSRKAMKPIKKSIKISSQLKKLAKQLRIKNARDLVEPDITDTELDQLLRKIQYNPQETLIDVAEKLISKQKKTSEADIKIQVLLDNLARKMCNCTTQYLEKDEKESATTNINAACRRRIFLNRNIDFITYDCGDAPKNKERFNYGEGPLLKPKLHSATKYTLRRPVKKSIKLN